MKADVLTTMNTTTRLDSTAYNDSTVIMLHDWQYYNDLEPLMSTKCWLQDSIQLFHQRNATYYTRHDGVFRTDKTMSESMLVIILLLETLLVAYLIKNGLKFINNSLKSVLTSEGRSDSSEDNLQKGSQFREYLWIMSVVVFALFAPFVLNIGEQRTDYELSSWLFLRIFIYVVVYFLVKDVVFRLLGSIFFLPIQTKRWIAASKTTLSFYAICLTPLLIGLEIGIRIEDNFLVFWILGFLLITKIWLLVKAINIFSIRIGYFLYLILYLCALEILPIFLFYKGLFLL